MKHAGKSEEIHDIIERIPTKFGVVVTSLVILIFGLTVTFGFIVNYPDMIAGTVIIRKGLLPLRIVTKNSGNIKLLVPLKENLSVQEGDYLAYFQNQTNVNNVHKLKEILSDFEHSRDYVKLNSSLKSSFLDYGEMTSKVAQLQALTDKLVLFKKLNIYNKESDGLKTSSQQQSNLLKEIEAQIQVRKSNLAIAREIFNRDSILFSKDLISKLDYERSNQTYLAYQESLYSLTKEEMSGRLKLKDLLSQNSEVTVQESDKKEDLEVQFSYFLNDVTESIKDWEHKYVLVCPITGRLDILKYVEDNQFVKDNEELFAIMPQLNEKFDAVLDLPEQGSGKVKVGQKVIVKLEDYPFKEFGSISGTVKSISKITKDGVDIKEGVLKSSYMVIVSFPDTLRTNFGAKINFKSGDKGIGEVVTNNSKLIERIFSHVKYSTAKN